MSDIRDQVFAFDNVIKKRFARAIKNGETAEDAFKHVSSATHNYIREHDCNVYEMELLEETLEDTFNMYR